MNAIIVEIRRARNEHFQVKLVLQAMQSVWKFNVHNAREKKNMEKYKK